MGMYNAQPDDIICTTIIEGERIDFAWPGDMLPPTHFNFDDDGEFIVGNYVFYNLEQPHHGADPSTNWLDTSEFLMEDGYYATGVGFSGKQDSALSGEITLVEVEGDKLIKYEERSTVPFLDGLDDYEDAFGE